MEKQEEMKPHADLIQLSPCQGCPAWHSSVVPEGLVCQDSPLVADVQEGGAPLGDIGNGVVLELSPGVSQPGLEGRSVLVQSQASSLWAPGRWEAPAQALESVRPQCAMEGLRHDPADGSSKRCADHSDLVQQNTKLLRALDESQHCCASLKEENCLLRKSCFPETEEKVKHLKRKNAELALIAKRLEERARKLQEANLKVVNAPVAVKGSSLELCKKACAHQRAKDLTEQASALLAKDKQIEALQQECWELQAKLTAGKEGPHCLNLIDFGHLLRESQKEVLRLQRQIALKNFKESLHSSKAGSKSSLSIAANCLGPSVPTLDTSINFSSLSKGVQLGEPTLAMEAHRKVEPGVLPLGHASEEYENFPPKSVIADPESSQQIQQLEFELRKKRKKCENLEHEVRKKHKRCKELEIQLQVVQGENARLAQENTQLNGKAEWARQVESENADLKLQVVVVTKERDSALQKSQGLQTKLENLEQVLKHMRDVAERRQQLEAEHEEAQLALQAKQEEVRWLQQAQAEAKRDHEGAVQLLEAQVRDLEDQCRSHIEQFSLLSQELKRFQLQTGKSGPLTSTLVTSELPLMPCCSIPQSQCHQWEKDPDVAPARPALQCTKKIHDEGSEELESLPQIPNPMSSVTKIPVSGAAATSQKQVKRRESQSSSSKSESMQNSPKSCPTPEETHTDPTAEDSWQLEWGDGVYFSHFTIRQAGVVTLFSPNLRPEVLGVTEAVPGHLLHLRVRMEGLVVNLVNIYAPTMSPKWPQFYQRVSDFLGTLDSHECLVLGGDFNTTLEEQDRSGAKLSPAAGNILRGIVEHHSLVDVWRDYHPDDTSTFTFVWVEAHQSHHSWLDRIYLSHFHLSQAHSSNIRPASFSDHHLATITASLHAERPGLAYWHFNNSLLEDEGFVTSFREF
ncbi:unnamed protein product [Caretta caretta]